jgi:hypothetical protein
MSGRINPLNGEFIAGDSDDPDQNTDQEALGLRHRRGFGYSTEGAREHDDKLLAQGGHPMHFGHSRQPGSGESRIKHFNHGVVGGIVG